MTAKIGLEDVRFHAPHGFYEEEHLMGNEFSIDVEVEASIAGAARNDDLGGTVNYATIYYLLQAEMKKPTQLLEALAYRMGNRIIQQFDGVKSVRLRLRKLHPPLGGKVGAAVVEINLSGGGGGAPPPPSRQMTFEDEGDFDDDFDDEGGYEGLDLSGFNLG
jgi:dihydroneopterin aldolase